MGLGGAAVMPQTLSIITNVFEPRERPTRHRDLGLGGRRGHRGRPDRRRPAARPLLVGLGLPHQRAADRRRHRRDRRPGARVAGARARAGWTTGVLLSIAGLVLVVYGIIQGGDTGPGCAWTYSVRSRRPGGAGGFVWYEARIDNPSLDVRLFRDPRLSSSAAAISLAFFAMSGAYFFISFYTQNVRGYSPLHAGLLTIPLAAGQLLLAPAHRARSCGRFGAKPWCTTGPGGHVAARWSATTCSATSTPVWLLGGLPDPGRRHGPGHAGRDRGRHVGRAPRAGRRWLGDHQYFPAGGGRPGRGGTRLGRWRRHTGCGSSRT